MATKIEITRYDDNHPCIKADGIVLTMSLDELDSMPDDMPWAVGESGDDKYTLLDTPQLDSMCPTMISRLNGVAYRRTGNDVEVDCCGKCYMDIAEVLLEDGTYTLTDDGKVVREV